jgi:hypothetical protein
MAELGADHEFAVAAGANIRHRLCWQGKRGSFHGFENSRWSPEFLWYLVYDFRHTRKDC